MTKEEIIHRLQYARYRIDNATYAPDVLKAIDIAIEMVGNTDSDTISRQAAISAICNACGKIDCDKMDKCEKLQLPPASSSEIPNSSDTISRAKAIDGKICIRRSNGVEIYDDYAVPVEYLEQLPPAQPAKVATDINVGDKDTISRKAAIEEIERWLGYIDDDMVRRMQIGMKRLPPAQPERIIHCKDCKYGILDSGFPHQRFCSFKGNEWNNDNHYCGHAKRREVTT